MNNFDREGKERMRKGKWSDGEYLERDKRGSEGIKEIWKLREGIIRHWRRDTERKAVYTCTVSPVVISAMPIPSFSENADIAKIHELSMPNAI